MQAQTNCARKIGNDVGEALPSDPIVSLCDHRARKVGESATVLHLPGHAKSDRATSRGFATRVADAALACLAVSVLAVLWPVAKLAGVFSMTGSEEQA